MASLPERSTSPPRPQKMIEVRQSRYRMIGSMRTSRPHRPQERAKTTGLNGAVTTARKRHGTCLLG